MVLPDVEDPLALGCLVRPVFLDTDPTDWATLRDELHGALAAAFGLEPPREPARPDGHRSEVFGAVPQLLDEIRHEHDPATDWDAFRETLWNRCHRGIRPGGGELLA